MALQWVREEIAKRQPSGLLITGDLTMRARAKEFAAAREWIGALDIPVKIEPGNHDLPHYYLPERYLSPMKRFEAFRQEMERQVDLPGLALINLNTNVSAQPRINWSKGWVAPKALRTCLAQIDALPTGTSAIVTVHHPLREAGTRGTALTKNGANALSEFAKRDVVAVLSGHVHDAFDLHEETQHGPIRMIGAGTLSHRLRSSPPGFNELIWDGTELTVHHHELN